MRKRKINITRIFIFDSAHFLINYNGKCKHMHGHTYKLEVTVRGYIGEDGMVLDFHDLKEVVEREILEKLDHKCLNDVFDFNTTCENTGVWIWGQLEKAFVKYECTLEKIVLWETPNSYITINKEDMQNDEGE